jgi:hypothetical protein
MSENPELPRPNPALRRLDRLVGRWSMEGNLVDSDEKNIKGETAFRWLPGGFFLEQRVQIDFVHLHRLVAPGRHLLRGLAPEPRRRRDHQCPLRHRRAPSRVADA